MNGRLVWSAGHSIYLSKNTTYEQREQLSVFIIIFFFEVPQSRTSVMILKPYNCDTLKYLKKKMIIKIIYSCSNLKPEVSRRGIHFFFFFCRQKSLNNSLWYVNGINNRGFCWFIILTLSIVLCIWLENITKINNVFILNWP